MGNLTIATKVETKEADEHINLVSAEEVNTNKNINKNKIKSFLPTNDENPPQKPPRGRIMRSLSIPMKLIQNNSINGLEAKTKTNENSASLPRKVNNGKEIYIYDLDKIDENVGTKCDSCPQTFKSKNKLKFHKMCHTNQNCRYCGKGFRFASLLKKHMSSCQEELLQDSGFCDMSRDSKDDLSSHEGTEHTDVSQLSLENVYISCKPTLV